MQFERRTEASTAVTGPSDPTSIRNCHEDSFYSNSLTTRERDAQSLQGSKQVNGMCIPRGRTAPHPACQNSQFQSDTTYRR